MIIGVTGTNGAGKGTVVDYLVAKGFKHYSVSGRLAEEVRKRGLPVDRPQLRLMGNEMREKYGAEYPNKLFLEEAQKEGITDLIIESIRSIKAAENIHENGGILLAVDADRKLRYERAVLRGSGKDKVDFDTWVTQEEVEWHNEVAHDMNVPGVIALADYTLENKGTLEELHAQIDEVLAKIGK
jgi:dephospho-CoA kinase